MVFSVICAKLCVENKSVLSRTTNLKEAKRSHQPSTQRPESKLLEEIVNDVGKKLNNQFLGIYDEDGFFGIDSRVKKVESFLCLESEDVRMIGIRGMGGIGRTTIADKVFNRIVNKFECQCFIANVQEELEKHTPVHLNDEILCKILGGEDFHVGTPRTLHPFINRSLQNRRVLIVLDDVECYLHLTELVGGWNLYGPGSRIIVTSRDKQVLEIVDCEKYIYEVEKLNDCESLKLFSLHAFKQTQSTNGYTKQLSERVISYTQGVPLALKVLGCSLYGKGVKERKSELEKLETIPNKEIQGVLRRSYDGLVDNEKKSGIRNLLDKSLITIFKEKLEMHDLLEQMCLEKLIFMDLSKTLRLPENLSDLESLENLKATGSGIKELPSSINQLKKLNYLNCDGCEGLILPPFTGLASLRMLSLQRCDISEIPSNLGSLESLVYLYLSGNNLRSLPTSIKKCSKLNTLDLSDCMMLQFLPELPPGLAELDAENCTSVEYVLRSFIQGYMNSCLRMNLSKCINLDKSECSELILLKLQSMGEPEEQYLNKKVNFFPSSVIYVHYLI
ncbi:disease resistance protein Roq1-like [Hevea brasiliensis]|uniref:disease resistance protein Roq1-like n=1 Tax=Hevea brasiliensis TaxID=3981 RepID=UPI0025D4A6F6|nr:disease resistance protein Roq1-like [Hevea brasiliensis]